MSNHYCQPNCFLMDKISLNSVLSLMAATLVFCACSGPKSPESVIPLPQQIQQGSGEFKIAGAKVECDENLPVDAAAYVESFAKLLAEKAPAGEGGTLKFILDGTLAPEEYVLEVERNEARVKASALNGFVYAVQTIKQLLPAQIWGDIKEDGATWTLPVMTIRDYPRFAYRGMHLDEARHFFGLEEVYRYIDIMVAHKMNRLHWHLTDDQGWRIEIKKYPRITEVGAYRKGTMIGRDFSSFDGIPYGGFYTQDELRQVVAYAAARGVTVIPEIDLPGHMQSVVAAYPDLGCTGGPYEVRTTWGVSDEVLCAGNERIYEVLEDILTEIMDIFPSEYIHIGGDECPKTRWSECPKCQAKIKALGLKDSDQFTAEDFLQSYVMNRVESFLNKHGRKIIGWDEVLDGNVSQSATIMSWRGAAGGIKAAQSGRDAIMTPNSYMYFDFCQARNSAEEPVSIGGFLPVSRVYSYEPYDEQMTPEECTRILGVQANLWTEYIKDASHLEYMLVPRISALSEVQWCKPENKDFARFRNSLANMRLIYDEMGLNYATHIFDGRMDSEERTAGAIKHKAIGKTATLLTEPHFNYRFQAPAELLDGKTGDTVFNSGAWIGWEGAPMELIIEMGSTSWRTVTVEALSNKGAYIFPPTFVKLSTSEDGENFQELCTAEFSAEGPDASDGVKTFHIDPGKKVKAPYLKVEVATIDRLPEWHSGAGAKAFLFIDEVVVK